MLEFISMSNTEEQYFLNKAKEILENGIDSDDRTGTGTKFLFSQKFDYDISGGKIPIWTTRKIPFKNQVWELIWMIRGDSNIKWLKERGVNIWDSWADADGSIGPTYSKQLRNWETPDKSKTLHINNRNADKLNETFFGVKSVDQFANLIQGLKDNPESRRHIIALWNSGEYADLQKPYLPSCHSNHIQIVIENKKYLHYQMVQRSADFLIGYCPWQHALFANIIGRLTGYEPKSMSVVITNCHIYKNQFDAAKEQISRIPTQFPTLHMSETIKSIKDVENSTLDDYQLIGYEPQPNIKIPISI